MNVESFRQDDIAVVGVVYDGRLDIDAVLSSAVDWLRSNDNRCLLRATPWHMTEPRVMWHSRIAGDPVSEAALA